MAALLTAGCASPSPKVTDPRAVLDDPALSLSRHQEALAAITRGSEEALKRAARRMLWADGYRPESRDAAFAVLITEDRRGLIETLDLRLPQMNAREGVAHLCERIAESGLIELERALIVSLSRPIAGTTEAERSETRALERLLAPHDVPSRLQEIVASPGPASDEGLRTRAWMILCRMGRRDDLEALLARDRAGDAGDPLLSDLRHAYRELGLLPRNREEILWTRAFCAPQRRAWWAEAREACSRLSPAHGPPGGSRDVPVIHAIHRVAPEVLDADDPMLDDLLRAELSGRPVHEPESGEAASGGTARSRYSARRTDLTRGDRLAIILALRALEVPQVRRHLFDIVDRDRADTTTEYGGVVALDEQGRFELIEFPPWRRDHDQKFITSQDMLERAYTGLFHFHLHAQRVRNGAYAGPGLGDLNYAEAMRASSLVITSIREDAVNVDFYRHGGVVVDLGEVARAP